MSFVSLLPVILSFLLLGAHFMHAGSPVLVGLSLAPLVLLLVRRWWVPRICQVLLLGGALEWLRTMVMLIGVYDEIGKPWHRMVIILGSVMVFTAASGLVFALPRMRRRYAGAASRSAGFQPLPSA